jgi:S-methylmethionine-dependent homocysteine/selenocysteine methylase
MTITILDGGMGQELVARAPEAPTRLWATQVMIDHPEIVRAIHDDYFAAGAQIATTNTYAVLHDRLEPVGIDDQFDSFHRIACEMAVNARDAHGSGMIAGALGPLGASYAPELAPEPAIAADLYAEIVDLHAPFVDLHLAETMCSVDQARGVLMATKNSPKPMWLALSVEDLDGTKLRSGEPVEAILPLLDTYRVDALLINCSSPEAVTQALPLLQNAQVPLGGYANGFTAIEDEFKQAGKTVDLLTARTDLDPSAYAEHARRWVDLGATIIGGCCEVGPAHISELSRMFSKA